MTSGLAHVGGLMVGVFALIKVGTDQRTWLYAIAWFVVVRQISQWTTPAELNVNLAHRVIGGWEGLFSAYWEFWIATTLAAAGGLWLMNGLLLRIMPGRASRRISFRRL